MNKSCKDKIEDYRYDTLFDWKKIFIIATAFTVLIILLTFTYYTDVYKRQHTYYTTRVEKIIINFGGNYPICEIYIAL